MATEHILITVKTYPTISNKYLETVCTAGITDTMEWRRLYPIRYRYLEGEKQYRLYDRISVDVEEAIKDGREESRRPRSDTIKVLSRLKTWDQRHQWVGPTILPSVDAMQKANRSIGAVAVDRVKDFIAIPDSAEWNAKQKSILEEQGLFADNKPLEKIPFQFRIQWVDADGHEHDSLFIDWEVCQTWRNYRHRYDDPLGEMRDMWMNKKFSEDRQIAFFMGNHGIYRNTFMVCGIYNPPLKEIQDDGTLF